MSVEKSTVKVTKIEKAPSQYYSPQQTRPNTNPAGINLQKEDSELPSVVEWVREETEETDEKKGNLFDKIKERFNPGHVLGEWKSKLTPVMQRIKEMGRCGTGKGVVFAVVHAKQLAVSGVASLVLVGISTAVIFSTCSLACRIKLGDKEIGNLPSEQVYYEILSDVKEEVLSAADVDFEPSGELSVNTVLIGKGQFTSAEDVKRRLKATSNEMILAWSITVDGKAMVALIEQPDALALLEEYRQQFAQEGATLSFRSKVEVAKEYVPLQIVKSKEDALAYLNGEGSQELLVQSSLAWETEEEIPFETEQRPDDTKYVGDTTVIQEGSVGTKYVKYSSVKINGEETKRATLKEEVLSAPIKQIELVGTKEPPSPIGTGEFAQPVSGTLTSNFGQRWNRAHEGIDIGASTGTVIYAADNGTVVYSQYNNGGYGNLVKIDHGNGYITCYAHCSELLVESGSVVAKGDPIAKVGSTGNSTGPHLHFEVRKDGEAQNPLEYLNK